MSEPEKLADVILNGCYRLLDSIQRGLGNPDLSENDYRRLADGLRPLDRLVWGEDDA